MSWDPSPWIFEIGGFGLRWYSVLFISGFLLSYLCFLKIVKLESKPTAPFENMLVVLFVSAIIGARLGHCLFYDPAYYLSRPWEILKVWEGGLASHGGTLGVVLGLYLWQRKKDFLTFAWVANRVCICTPLAAAFIRMGNFMNQEILGKPTESSWGIRFLSGDPLLRLGEAPVLRHPTQLYEALSYLVIFFLMLTLYRVKRPLPDWSAFGLMFFLIFGARFFLEFSKERQAAFETGVALNMGQILSLPFALTGLGLLIWSLRRSKT